MDGENKVVGVDQGDGHGDKSVGAVFDKNGIVGSVVQFDGDAKQTAIDIFKMLHGRDPSADEIEKLDAKLAAGVGKEVSMDPLPVNPDATIQKSMKPRDGDGDGDGKVFDGTPHEQILASGNEKHIPKLQKWLYENGAHGSHVDHIGDMVVEKFGLNDRERKIVEDTLFRAGALNDDLEVSNVPKIAAGVARGFELIGIRRGVEQDKAAKDFQKLDKLSPEDKQALTDAEYRGDHATITKLRAKAGVW